MDVSTINSKFMQYRKIIIITATYLFILLLSTRGFAQNYLMLKKQTEHHLDSLHKIMPDSLFFHEGGEYDQFQQWVDFWGPRLFLNGNFDDYYKRKKQGLEMMGQRSFSTYNALWKEIGPTNEPSGVMPFNSGQSAGIGPVEFIRFHRANPQNMVCGSTKGGLFFSNNGGDNWVNAGSDHWTGGSAVTWAEFKVNDPEVIYASSGEPSDNTPGPIQGTGGIYRARKNGTININTQWDLIASINNCFSGKPNCIINKILTDPFDPNVLYAATTWGLFKSSNVNAAAPTWQNILTDNVFDIEIRPGVGNHLTLYASFDRYSKSNAPNPNPSTNSNMIKYSLNGGATWSILPNSPANLLINSMTNISHVSIEVSDGPGFQPFIYLYYYSLDLTNPAYKNIYKYNFNTQSFVNIFANIDTYSAGDFNNCCFGSGTAWSVSKSGTNEVVFVAYQDRYARLVNGSPTYFGYNNPNFSDYHADVEGFTINPNNANEIWMASHGGTYKSIDQGLTWIPKMKGVGVAMVFYMADSHENPEDILISTYHDGCILTEGAYSNSFWNPPWKYVWGGDGQEVLIDNKDPNYMYASGVGSGWAKSTDGGITPFTGIGFDTGYNWGTIGTLNKENTNIIYGRRNQEIVRATDRGTSAGNVISNIATLANVSSSCASIGDLFTFENNKDLLIVTFYSCTNCDMYYTLKATDPAIDPINDWHKISIGNGGRPIYDIDLDPLNSSNIYVLLYPDWSGGSMKCIYKVENFTSLSPNIIDLTGNFPPTGFQRDCLVLEKGSNDGIYVATDLGTVFYTNNAFISNGLNNAWVQFGNNYPHVTTNGLEINYKVNKLRAVPYSRGIWEADLYCPPAPYVCTNCNSTNNPFWEGTYVSMSNSIINTTQVTIRGTDYIEILPGGGSNFTLLDPGNNTNTYYQLFIHGCKPGQANTF